MKKNIDTTPAESGDDFNDMMPTAEEFWYDAQPEAYEPSCYDGTYSEE
jgi:hypothetical protein